MQEGLYQHFKAVAESVKIPIILTTLKGAQHATLNLQQLHDLPKTVKILSALRKHQDPLIKQARFDCFVQKIS